MAAATASEIASFPTAHVASHVAQFNRIHQIASGYIGGLEDMVPSPVTPRAAAMDADMVAAATLAGRNGKFSDIRSEMETAKTLAQDYVKANGITGQLTAAQLDKMTKDLEAKPEFQTAMAGTQKTSLGKKTAVGAGVTATVLGGLATIATAVVAYPVKWIASAFGKKDSVPAGKLALGAGAAVLAAVSLIAVPAALIGHKVHKNNELQNPKRADAMRQMAKLTLGRAAREQAGIAPSAAASNDPAVESPAIMAAASLPVTATEAVPANAFAPKGGLPVGGAPAAVSLPLKAAVPVPGAQIPAVKGAEPLTLAVKEVKDLSAPASAPDVATVAAKADFSTMLKPDALKSASMTFDGVAVLDNKISGGVPKPEEPNKPISIA